MAISVNGQSAVLIDVATRYRIEEFNASSPSGFVLTHDAQTALPTLVHTTRATISTAITGRTQPATAYRRRVRTAGPARRPRRSTSSRDQISSACTGLGRGRAHGSLRTWGSKESGHGHSRKPVLPFAYDPHTLPAPDRFRGGRNQGDSMLGTDAGPSAHAPPLRPPRRDAGARQGDRHRHRHRAPNARPTATGPSAPTASAACSTRWASPPTAGSPRSPGTPSRHLELYFAAPCTGRVLHTLNIRLFPEQVTYIVNHAEDEVIFVDRSLLGLLGPLLPTFDTVRHVVVMDDGGADRRSRRGRAARLRGAAGRGRRRSSSGSTTSTAPRRCVTRRAPPATRRASSTPTARRSCTRWRVMLADSLGVRERDAVLPGRADVPRQRLGSRPCRGRERRQARAARDPG